MLDYKIKTPNSFPKIPVSTTAYYARTTRTISLQSLGATLNPDPRTMNSKPFGLIQQSTLEAQLPIYWVPVLKSLYKSILSVAQGPTIWVPGLPRGI